MWGSVPLADNKQAAGAGPPCCACRARFASHADIFLLAKAGLPPSATQSAHLITAVRLFSCGELISAANASCRAWSSTHAPYDLRAATATAACLCPASRAASSMGAASPLRGHILSANSCTMGKIERRGMLWVWIEGAGWVLCFGGICQPPFLHSGTVGSGSERPLDVLQLQRSCRQSAMWRQLAAHSAALLACRAQALCRPKTGRLRSNPQVP